MTKQELTDKEKLEKVLELWIEKGARYKDTPVKFVTNRGVNKSSWLHLGSDKHTGTDGEDFASFNDILLDSNIFEVLFKGWYNSEGSDFISENVSADDGGRRCRAFFDGMKRDWAKIEALMSKDRIGTLYDLLFPKDHD